MTIVYTDTVTRNDHTWKIDRSYTHYADVSNDKHLLFLFPLMLTTARTSKNTLHFRPMFDH